MGVEAGVLLEQMMVGEAVVVVLKESRQPKLGGVEEALAVQK